MPSTTRMPVTLSKGSEWGGKHNEEDPWSCREEDFLSMRVDGDATDRACRKSR
jgi:hypothetical protein